MKLTSAQICGASCQSSEIRSIPVEEWPDWIVKRAEADLSLHSVTIPALIIAGANAYVLWNEHWSHWEHLPPLEERTEYPYQNIRSRNFYWGDGDKVSSSNPLPKPKAR